MRIAFITHNKHLYGANRSLLNLIEGLVPYNILPFVVSPERGELSDILDSRHIPNAMIPMWKWMEPDFPRPNLVTSLANFARWQYQAAGRLYKNLLELPMLIKQLLEWQVDVIYSNSSVIPIGAMASGRLKLPHIWHIREFGVLDFGLRYDWGEKVFRHYLCQASARIAVSESVRKHILDDGVAENNYVIYNGVAWQAEFDSLYKRAHSEQPNKNSYTFAIIGMIQTAKGQEEAIKALSITAQKYPNVRLIIAGGGGKKNIRACKLLVAELGLKDKVEFMGYVNDPYEVFLKADAILVCSRYEAMGRVTAEAMAACRPVIGYDEGGTSELIEHERTGMLYYDGLQELAACMARFIENPGWACQLGENGWHSAREKFSIEKYSQQVYAVLRSLTTHEIMNKGFLD